LRGEQVLRKVSISLLVLVVVAGGAYTVWVGGANERAEADARPLFVPTILTPSVQLVNGQVLLYRVTNVSENPRNMRLMLYTEQDNVPTEYQDFSRIPSGTTVSYTYEPPKGRLTLGETTVDAPKPVRAVFAPVPGDDPGAIRNFVATVEIMRIQPGVKDVPILDPPIIVPVEHCNFEPRGFVPYTGGRWYWNCAPDMFPLDERWHAAGQESGGGRGGAGNGGGRGNPGARGGRGNPASR
jgi:uncharacterized membrane protein YgcG